jgi:CubicO group peptidase (beta-lactamase class C family)
MIAGKLATLLQQVVDSFDVPGLAVGVVQGDEVVLAEGFGVKRYGTQEPIIDRSLFHMASVSKPFAATSLVQLLERGKVDLDAPVVAYLPYFKLDDIRFEQLTLRQLLTHTSGMPDVEDYEWDKAQYDQGAVERYVRSLGAEKLIHAPGEAFAYSNMAFEVLADVISKVTGQPFEHYVKDEILNPLGMHDSTFLRAQVPAELGVAPHITVLITAVSQVYPYNRRHAASSTLHSNAAEMCNWMRANLNRGILEGHRILEAASYDDLLWKPQAPIDAQSNDGKAPDRFVGLSWFLWEYKGHRAVGHAGGDVGFRSNVVMLPDLGIGVAVMANTIPAPVEVVTDAALDIALGLEPASIKPPVMVRLGRALREEGVDAAVSEFQDVQQTQADAYDLSVEGLWMSAHAASWLKAVDDAILVVDLIRTVYPETSEQANTYEFLGELYADSGENQLAIENLQRALEIDPDNAGAAEKLDRLLAS